MAETLTVLVDDDTPVNIQLLSSIFQTQYGIQAFSRGEKEMGREPSAVNSSFRTVGPD